MVEDTRGHENDWSFLTGTWHVRHRRTAKSRSGGAAWQEFDGTCESRPMLAGQAQVDEYVMHAPDGIRRALAIRSFSVEKREWSIWWIDSRDGSSVGEPVRGTFAEGGGLFFGDDVHEGRPVRVRFVWSEITDVSARWEQAFSSDGGDSWEPNWIMTFTRRPQA